MNRAQMEQQMEKVQELVQEKKKVLVAGRSWSVSQMQEWLRQQEVEWEPRQIWFGLGQEKEGELVKLVFEGEELELVVVRGS
jgi:Asp-tRNA(Asn)/Glu-tRNA(Gln) amidotransferase C subunit